MSNGKWTRRGFLEAVGRAGGAAAVYEAMTAMGLLRVPDAFGGPPELPPDSGNGKRVVILGAGIAGLAAGYRLMKANYDVAIFEAKSRPGGRSYTVRRGDVIEENTGTRQICKFDEGPQMYLNAGPGRLPYHHTEILRYCNELGVELEVYNMMSRANYYQRDGYWNSKSVTNRRIANDVRGWFSELLAKAVRKNALDKELAGVDKDGLLDLLAYFGDVEAKDGYQYRGSSRSGYEPGRDPGIEDCGVIVEPLTLQDLVSSRFWRHAMGRYFYQPEEYEWQPTLFQPVRGMDQIWRAFLPRLGSRVQTGKEAVRIDNVVEGGAEKVRVQFRGGDQITADFCISTIPMPILARIGNNFSDDYKKAIGAVNFAPTCKVGWQSNYRFWEKQDQMYGGISYVEDPITQMWYPSYDYFGEKGILTGAYNYGDDANAMAKMAPYDRLRVAMAGAKRLHPDFDRYVPMDLGVSIAWKNVPFQEGGWADDWDCSDPVQEAIYRRLLEPEKRFIVAGDQVSYISGWQEGAVRSAHHAISKMTGVPQPKAATPMLRSSIAGGRTRKAPPSVKRRTRGLP